MDHPPLKIGMMPVAPGEFIREEILDKLAFSVCGAEILGLRDATLSDFVNRYAVLQPVLALRIEKTFGINMGTIAGVDGGLLLGQSFLGRFKAWSIDNRNHTILLNPISK